MIIINGDDAEGGCGGCKMDSLWRLVQQLKQRQVI